MTLYTQPMSQLCHYPHLWIYAILLYTFKINNNQQRLLVSFGRVSSADTSPFEQEKTTQPHGSLFGLRDVRVHAGSGAVAFTPRLHRVRRVTGTEPTWKGGSWTMPERSTSVFTLIKWRRSKVQIQPPGPFLAEVVTSPRVYIGSLRFLPPSSGQRHACSHN